jgi:hypothetical protein
MTTTKLNQTIYARLMKNFNLMQKRKMTLEENMEMYIKMMRGYKRKYPAQMSEILKKVKSDIALQHKEE